MAHQPSQSDRAPNEGPTARAEAALTHPATLLALATLLVNDLVFKWLWPGAWITGKLSDLAWIVFAPPLLALLLTFLARRDSTAQKAVWVIAYIGLPLLYAAYNTFEPLHDAVMTGFSLLRGTPGGSPFDPADSIVIPFGVTIAIWIWRNAEAKSAPSRTRAALLIAAIAAFASIATSAPDPPTGITTLTQDETGSIFAKGHRDYEVHRSDDGGFTWERVPADSTIDWQHTPNSGPEFTYNLQDETVILTIGEYPTIEHRVVDLNQRASYRIFALAKDSTGADFWRLAHLPQDVLYDVNSGNVIVAMGLQGVVVRTPDALWRRVGVGPYEPIDYSLANRARLLISPDELLFIAIAISIASTAFVLPLATVPIKRRSHRYVLATFIAAVGIVCVLPLVFAGGVVAYDLVLNFSPFGEDFFGIALGFILLLFALLGFVSLIAVIVATTRAFRVSFVAVIGPVVALLLLVASLVPLIYYSETDTYYCYDSDCLIPTIVPFVVVFTAIWFVIGAFVKLPTLRGTLPVILALVAMMAAFVLVFLVWVSGHIALVPAKISSTILIWIIAALLYKFVRNAWRNEPPAPDDQVPDLQSVYPVRLSKNAKDDRTSPCPTTPSTTPPSTSQTKPHS